MATQSQIQSFASTWGTYATQVGNSLGVSPGIILAQWGLESGYGTNSGSANNNVAGIMAGGAQASYNSPEAFAQAYTNLITSGYPNAVNTGNDVNAFTTALQNGINGAYFGSDETASTYAAGITGAAGALQSNASDAWNSVVGSASGAAASNGILNPTDTGTATSVAGTGTTGTAATGSCGSFTSFFTWTCWQSVAGDLALVGIGVFIIILAIASGVFGSAGKTVVTMSKRASGN